MVSGWTTAQALDLDAAAVVLGGYNDDAVRVMVDRINYKQLKSKAKAVTNVCFVFVEMHQPFP